MDITKTNKTTWILFCLLLFAPLFVEVFFLSLITFENEAVREPRYFWGTIHFLYCYIAYGAVCFLYLKWQKKIDLKISFKPQKDDIKWLLLAFLMGFGINQLKNFAFGYGPIYPFGIVSDFNFYLKLVPLWIGVAGVFMQYIYYIIEFILAALIIDCGQKTSIRLGWTQKLPWGGILLMFTWRLIHPTIGFFTTSPINIPSAIGGALLALTMGFAYMLPCKKNIRPLYAFLAVMAWYWI